MPEERAEAGFELEAEDLAQKLDAELLEIERERHAELRAARVGAALKTAHTLKGLAAVVGQPTVARTCHLLEDLLKAIQRDSTAPSAHIVNLMLAAGSILCAATQTVRQGKVPDELLKPILQQLESAVRIAGQPEQESSVSGAVQPSPAAPALTPAVRVSDDKLDAILAVSEEIHNAAAVIRMR